MWFERVACPQLPSQVFFLVELFWMFFDSWSCSQYYCIRNSKMHPCVKLFLLLTRFYSLPKTMAVLIYFYFWKCGSWGLYLQWWFFLSVSCIQALMIQDFLVAFLFSVNQCFGDLNFPSKLYSESFLIKLDLPPLLDHKKYLVANFVVGKEPTHFCVCVQHILMDSRCCFYLRASRRISGV